MYNMTNITAANTVYEIVKATNDMSTGLFFGLLLPILFFVFLVTFKRRDFKKVLLGDCFFMVIVTGIAWGAGWVSWTFLIIPVILFGAVLIAYQFIDG